jgi:glycosyltransferase involved in cell wall biosynthesis
VATFERTLEEMNKETHNPKIILILGMHRSGTSLVAQLVAEWGAYMGNDLMPPDENNPNGYWEFNPLVAFHDKMLNDTGATWSAPLPEIPTDSLIERYREEALGLVENMDQQGKTWCWKDPRTALFLGFWKNILHDRELNFIIVHRDLAKIANSLYLRDKMPGALAVGLWEYYTLKIFDAISGLTNYCIVNYDQLICHPDQEVSGMVRFLELAVQGTGNYMKDASWIAIIDKNLNRSQPIIKVNPTPLQQELTGIYTRKTIPPSFSPSVEAIARLHNLFCLARDTAGNSQNLYYAQLFFQTENDLFSEENSLTRINPLPKERFFFDLKGITNVKTLRFDPLNDFVHLILHEITFLKDKQKLSITVSLTSNAFRHNGSEFLFDTLDPQIFIHSDESAYLQPDALILAVEYLKRGESAVISFKSVILEEHAQQLSEQKSVVSEQKKYISKQNTAIKELSDRVKEYWHTIEMIHKRQEELNRNLVNFCKTWPFRLALFATSLKRWKHALTNFTRIREEIRILDEIWQMKKNGFDEDQYFTENPDVIPSRLTAARHFVQYGRAEQRKGGRKTEHASEKTGHLQDKNPILRISKKTAGLFIEKPEIDMVRKSAYFEAEFYLRMNPDVDLSGMEPAAHFCHFGWKEGRNPGPNFDVAFYLETYEDVKKHGINPLIHFLRFGATEKRLPRAFEYDENECIASADLTGTDHSVSRKGSVKIAIVCHLFYPDLTDEFINYLRQVPSPFDLFITTTENNLKFLQDTFRQELPDVPATIITLPNYGRDVAPFLHILQKYLKDYDLACKIHTKKSGHDKNLEEWRRFMLDQLLGNQAIIKRIINAFEEDEKLGIVWPLPHPYLKYLEIDRGWGPDCSREHNFLASLQFFPDMEIPKLDEKFEFPAGNMFWFRPCALEYLVNKEFLPEDFDEESGQIDGTLPHAVERMTGRIAEKSGYTTATVYFPREIVENDGDRSIDFPDRERIILFIAHDLSRAGSEMVLLHLLYWFRKYTAYKLYVLALKKGNDGGKLLHLYRRTAKVILLNELQAKHPGEITLSVIKNEVGHPDLIYGNTILAATIYGQLKGFMVPFITHVHEMEESIRRYSTPEIMENLRLITTAFIPCSAPVKTNLQNTYGINPAFLHQVEEFIHIDLHPFPDRALQRYKTGLPAGKVIIWGCGTIYWRKGTDLFIETAGILKTLGVENFIFCWIGSNQWNNDQHDWGEWQKQEERIHALSLMEHVVFMGEKERPKDYFKAGDIFYLPSREDPYPLVCLEAAECKLPVVCFDSAGGMPGFVEEDAGAVVPFADTGRAAEAIAKLISQPDLRITQGKAARAKLLARHTDDIAVPRILSLCRMLMKAPPAISVIVPVFNHAPFLRERLDSILTQKFRDVEIIILDDASTDDSAIIAADYLIHPAVRLIRNQTNDGSPFRQWQKGIAEAKGKLVWIAEGDDAADVQLLTTLIPAFRDEQVLLAYCGSHCMDENGVVSHNHYLRTGHYEGLAFPRERWQSDYVADGKEEIAKALSVRNTIPNVSAVLFRRTAFSSVDFSETDQLRTTGDWRIYISILKNGKLAFSHQHLNYHRIRSRSVVGSNKSEAVNTLPDYFRLHRFLVEEFDIPPSVRELMIKSINKNLRPMYPNLSDEAFWKLYDVGQILKKESKNLLL